LESSEELLKIHARIAAKGGHLLLNVGPDATGRIPPESVRILKAVGEQLAKGKP